MTIQVVDITKLGLVMAADGAITFDDPGKGARKPEHWRRRKLIPIPHLRGAIGYFGLAQIDGKPLDKWLERFIYDNRDAVTGQAFAQRLANILSMTVSKAESQHKLGFHLGMYRTSNAGRVPEMHFVRNYYDLEKDGNLVLSRQFKATEELLGNHFHNLTGEMLLANLNAGLRIFFQNGYQDIYNAFATPLMDSLANFVWTNPEFKSEPKTVKEWGKVTEFRLKVVRVVFEKFYGKPGHQPVGGRLQFIAISPDQSRPLEKWSVG